MTANRRRRSRATQPTLPLSIPDGAPLPDPPLPDWRLDDLTRQIGRQGIAEARARLAKSSSSSSSRRAQHGDHRSDRAA